MDSGSFHAFVADVWSARGFDVTPVGDADPGRSGDGDTTFLATDDEGRERRVRVLAGPSRGLRSWGSQRGVRPGAQAEMDGDGRPPADVVVVQQQRDDPGDGVVDTDELRRQLLYALDRSTARTLFESYVDRPLFDPVWAGPDASGRATGRLAPAGDEASRDGSARPSAWVRRRLRDALGPTELVGVAVVLMVLLAAVATGLPAGLASPGADEAGVPGTTAAPEAPDGRETAATPTPRGTTGVIGAPPLVRARIDNDGDDGPGRGPVGDDDAGRPAGGTGPPVRIGTPMNNDDGTRQIIPGANATRSPRTNASEGVDRDRLPPGVRPDGTIDVQELATAHAAVLSNTSYRVDLLHREFVDGRPSGLQREVIRVENGTTYRTDVETVGRLLSDAQVVVDRETYADGRRRYVRGGADGTEISSFVAPVSGSRVADRLYNYVRWFLWTETVRVVDASTGQVIGAGMGRARLGNDRPSVADGDGTSRPVGATADTTGEPGGNASVDATRQYWVLFADDPYGSVGNVTGTARIDESGLVRNLNRRYQYAGSPAISIAVSIRITRIGETTVEPPAWYLNRSNVAGGGSTGDPGTRSSNTSTAVDPYRSVKPIRTQ
jgi:hypothetical protein